MVRVVKYSSMEVIPFSPSTVNIVSVIYTIYILESPFERKKALDWIMYCGISVTSPWV